MFVAENIKTINDCINKYRVTVNCERIIVLPTVYT